MFKVEDGTIHCSRGDKGIITLKIPIENEDGFYIFKAGDQIKLNIYKKKGYSEDPLKIIITDITEECDHVDIYLTEEDTTFGNISNKPVTYWYDITLNDNQTIVCYNEDGAREFIQYPAKGVDE